MQALQELQVDKQRKQDGVVKHQVLRYTLFACGWSTISTRELVEWINSL